MQPGNFDSITSETRYLFGDVTIATVPEPAAWTMMILGLGAVGGALRFRRREAGSLAEADAG